MSPYYKLTEQYIHFTCVIWEQTKQHTNTSKQKNKQTKTKNKKQKQKQTNKQTRKIQTKKKKMITDNFQKDRKTSFRASPPSNTRIIIHIEMMS
jgi:hypothetical protein